MGFWDTITDLVEAATPWSVADAEAPEEPKSDAPESEEETSTKDESKSEPEDDKSDEKSDDAAEEEPAEEEGEEEEEDEEEEDEDDDEPKDPKEELEEQCAESKQCAPAKHHYDECVERVTSQQDEDGAKEDCVEEFFHLAHCATQCAAPKLWSRLK